jgi:hypothetical protein
MQRVLRVSALAVVVVLIGACASSGERSDRPRSDRNVISLEEIQESQALNAYELVERVRPTWLRPRAAGGGMGAGGQGILVYRDTTRMGGIDELRRMALDGIIRLRFLDPSTAQATLPAIGSGTIAGAIVLDSR